MIVRKEIYCSRRHDPAHLVAEHNERILHLTQLLPLDELATARRPLAPSLLAMKCIIHIFRSKL